MTTVLIAAHYLIGYIWQTEFKPAKTGLLITAIAGGLIYIYQVLLSYPWAPLKFAAVMQPTLFFLKKSVKAQTGENYLQVFAGKVRLQDCLLLLFMPLAASIVYSTAYLINLDTEIIEIISAIPGIYGLTLLGWVCWIGAMAVIIKTQNT